MRHLSIQESDMSTPFAALIGRFGTYATPSPCLANEYYGFSARLKLVALASGPSPAMWGYLLGLFRRRYQQQRARIAGLAAGVSGPLARPTGDRGWGGATTEKDDGGSPEVPYAGWVLVV